MRTLTLLAIVSSLLSTVNLHAETSYERVFNAIPREESQFTRDYYNGTYNQGDVRGSLDRLYDDWGIDD